MTLEATDYYIIFDTNTDAMALDAALRTNKIPARVSPTPHLIQDRAGCGVSLLVTGENISAARELISNRGMRYFDIVPLPRQINPRRDHFC